MSDCMPNRDHGINYIEFDVVDIDRAKRFYSSAFGWSFTDYGPGYCEFNDGFMKGGFAQSGRSSWGGPLVVLYANDLEATQAKVLTAGGEIIKPIFSFPGGRRFHFRDQDGYEMAVWSEPDGE